MATALIAALAGLRLEWAGVIAVASAVLVGTRVLDGVIAQVVDPVRGWYDDRNARRDQALAVLHESTPAVLAQVDAYKIGVFASMAAEEYRDPTEPRPPYVRRIIDDRLHGAIEGLAAADGGVVVVKGHPKAGKSRTLWEALAAVEATRTRTLYALRPPDGRNTQTTRPLETFVAANLKLDGHQAVVWIDDAHEHFEYGLTVELLHKLAARYPGLIVAMTVHTHSLDPPPRRESQLSAVDANLLRHLDERAKGHDLTVELDETERAAARQQYPGLEERIEDPSDFRRLPGWFAGVSYLRRRYRNHRHDNPGGVAVAKAAIDWRRAGMPVGMCPGQLRELAEIELDELGHGQTFTDTSYQSALEWAKGEDPDSDPKFKGIALLRPVLGSRGALWRDFDAITAWAPTDDGPDGPLTDSCWMFVLKQLTEDTGTSVGVQAYRSDKTSIAETAFRMSADGGDPDAMMRLGVLIAWKGGDEKRAEAEQWLRRASELDYTVAMRGLGILLEDQGGDENRAEAEQWYRRAIELGDTSAMHHLGVLLDQQGGDENRAEAKDWYRRAAELNNISAMHHLGVLLDQQGGDENRAEAEQWFRRAAELNNISAMHHLGVQLMLRGGDEKRTEAEQWLRRAIELGNTHAMDDLGALFLMRGGEENLAEAEQWFRRAIDLGDTRGIYDLGIVLGQQGGDENRAEAEQWFEEARRHGVHVPQLNGDDT
jgi:TPR repeat protein